MRGRTCVCFAWILFLVLGTPGHTLAQPKPRHSALSLGIAGGLAIPARGLADATERGWSAELRLGVRIIGPIRLQGEVGLSNLPGRQLVLATAPRHRISRVAVELRLGGRTGPYLLAGGGGYRFEAPWPGEPERATIRGVNAGAGVAFGLGGLRIFLEGRMHNFDYKNGLYAPLLIGIEL